MKRDVILVENFYDDPVGVVAYAQSLPYVDFIFRGMKSSRFIPAHLCPFKSNENLIASLEHATGETLDREFWRAHYPLLPDGRPRLAVESATSPAGCVWNAAFHSTSADHAFEIGATVHNHTDADKFNSVGSDGWVGIIYFEQNSAHLQGGLRTWRNRHRENELDWMTPKENWHLLDTYACIYNRLILHRGGMPHSASPGWGTHQINSRFYQTFFFRSLQVDSMESCRP